MDLRSLPLLERKKRLKALLNGADRRLGYVDYVEGDGIQVLKGACNLKLEGIVSKRLDSQYQSGRTDLSRKAKGLLSDTFVIIGYSRR